MGKSLKGIHMVNAWACNNKLILGSMRLDNKSNEITVIPKLLKLIDISDCAITMDAMGCQRKIAKVIVENKEDYALNLKGKQKDLIEELEAIFKGILVKESGSAYGVR